MDSVLCILTDWTMIVAQGKIQLLGMVVEDDQRRFKEGDSIRTSQVVATKSDIVVTRNSEYLLQGEGVVINHDTRYDAPLAETGVIAYINGCLPLAEA